jgi:hypothetical protein
MRSRRIQVRDVRRLGVVLVIVLVAAGCSGSSKTAAPNTSSAEVAAETALAKRAVVQLADLPAGYAQFAVDKHSPDPAAQAKLLSCLGVPSASGRAGRVLVRGLSFAQKLNSTHIRQVGSAVAIEPTEAEAEHPLAVLAQGRAAACLETYLKSTFASDPRIARLSPRDLRVRLLRIAAPIGDQEAAFDAQVELSAGGQTLPVAFDFYFARTGRAVAELFTGAISTAFPASEQASLLRKMVGGLQAVG